MATKIRCAACKYARQDKKASEYSVKHCAGCEARDDCEVCRGCKNYKTCAARVNPNKKQSCDRRFDMVCGQQILKWAAFECTNARSEYHKALLNVTVNGDMQNRVTWGGCEFGERAVGV